MDNRSYFFCAIVLTFAAGLMSCGSNGNPNLGRVLTGISVTPATADAQTYTNGQVIFTATGTFSLPPTPAPVSFAAPYTGQFLVSNPTNSTIASIVSTGTGTITVSCNSGASGSVQIIATASANNGTTTTISGSAQLTCP